jgi:hypothetical protein
MLVPSAATAFRGAHRAERGNSANNTGRMEQRVCVVCRQGRFTRLTDPSPAQSVVSDLRVIFEPLNKWQCTTCAAVQRNVSPATEGLFESGYALYAHSLGQPEESRRQGAYAGWLAERLPAPRSCFEAGSGNGSLISALTNHWPKTSFWGVEPADGSAREARAAKFNVATGFLERRQPHEQRADLALAVNVIEHTADPHDFLAKLASHGERVAIVCPDATTPNTEVLFADHLHSFRPHHVAALFAKAGLAVDTMERAPASLGAFQLVSGYRQAERAVAESWMPPDGTMDAYLLGWNSLDESLLRRIGSEERITAFGAGEAAGLLRAYAPRTWSRVEACVVDAPESARFGDLPILLAASVQPGTILVAVRAAAAAVVAERLTGLGHRTIRWDDIVTM